MTSDHIARLVPVEADRCRTQADLVRAKQRWQRPGNAAEQRRGLRGRGVFLRLDLLPSFDDLSGCVEGRFAGLPREYVRMTADQFVGYAGQ